MHLRAYLNTANHEPLHLPIESRKSDPGHIYYKYSYIPVAVTEKTSTRSK